LLDSLLQETKKENNRMRGLLLLAIIKVVVGQERTTEGSWETVTYNPGIGCLPYDGSIVPDCSKYVDPITKQPFFKEHSSNCSRFWLCGPEGETCLNECAHCGGPNNPVLCGDQWALTFDPSFQYPLGPVCNWPVELDCGETLVCDVAKPEYECCENQDCCACPGHCYCAFNSDESASQCVQESPCDCTSNSECAGFDGVCNVPPPHDLSSCSYCEDHECKPGCIDNGNCPDGYECNEGSHECEQVVCFDDPDCAGFDQVCNAAHDNCFFCGDGSDCASTDGCCQGCHDSDLNCAYPTPVCNQGSHLCGCSSDADCNSPDYCDTDNNQCVAPCAADNECDGWDAICNEAYDNCFYCGDCQGPGCCPGCGSDNNCAYPTPICQDDHNCGCNTDSDCKFDDYCNTDTNQCEAQCVEDNECDGSDAVCNDAYDNCFYCGDCDGFGCCPGCSTDNNCVYPSPVCQDDHKCGCNSDADCKAGDQCTDSNICEPIPNECEADVDCNGDGISGTCEAGVAEYTQCFYCDSNGLYNVCKPGCKFDNNADGNVPQCPAAESVCNAETHFCQAQSGSTLLTKMVFNSNGCDGCTTEGVNMTLTGSIFVATPPECKTVNLDHPGTPDYVSKGTFLATHDEQNNGWASCYRRGLEGQISEAEVTWTGEGTWSPNNICFDWDKESFLVSVCIFPDGTTLNTGENAVLTCSMGSVTDCSELS